MADRDKTARAGAIHDKIAEEVVEFLAEQPIEATLDNTVDPYIELVDQEVVTEPFIENLEDPEGAKSREKYHQIVCRIAGGAGTIIEAVSEASGRRSHYT